MTRYLDALATHLPGLVRDVAKNEATQGRQHVRFRIELLGDAQEPGPSCILGPSQGVGEHRPQRVDAMRLVRYGSIARIHLDEPRIARAREIHASTCDQATRSLQMHVPGMEQLHLW